MRRLLALETPRVWSLLVTIFGDLAQNDGDRIKGPVLTRLTEQMGLRSEAVRVALHRLRREGWINSVKSGREALHALTPQGRTESRRASPLIYSALESMPQEWQFVVLEDGGAQARNQLDPLSFVQIGPRLYVGSVGARSPSGALVLTGHAAPDWVFAQAIAPAVTEQFERLQAELVALRQDLPVDAVLPPTDRAVLRCLIVHHWRRLVLRHPYLPPNLTGEAWAAHQCRAEVTELLTRLPKPLLSEL